MWGWKTGTGPAPPCGSPHTARHKACSVLRKRKSREPTKGRGFCSAPVTGLPNPYPLRDGRSVVHASTVGNQATHAVAFSTPIRGRHAAQSSTPCLAHSRPSTAPPALPRWVPARWGLPPARTPSPTRRAQSRPRRACPLDRPFLLTLPTPGSAKPGAASRAVFRRYSMTGFDGFLHRLAMRGGLGHLGTQNEIREGFGRNLIS